LGGGCDLMMMTSLVYSADDEYTAVVRAVNGFVERCTSGVEDSAQAFRVSASGMHERARRSAPACHGGEMATVRTHARAQP
jgi:hypothetical protein